MKQLSEEKPSKTSLLPEYKVLRDYSLLTYTIVVGMTVSLILFFLVLNNDSKIEQAQFEERVRSELKFHSEALDRYAFRLAISSKIWKAAERTKTEFEESTDLKISEQEFPFGCLGSYSYSGDPEKNSVHW